MHAIYWEGALEDNYLGHIMAEVYKDRVYDQFLAGRNNLTILDIGANVGITSHYFSQFAKNVYSVEPSTEHFGCLTQMIAFNKLENVIPINRAMYIKDGSYPLFHNPNRTMFSLHTGAADPNMEPEMVETMTFETLFGQQKLEHVDFMKMDVEGSEVELLSSPSFKKVADKIDMLVTEVHAWSGRNPNQVIDALEIAGFSVEQIPNDATLLVARRI